jgi:hypothetical protein
MADGPEWFAPKRYGFGAGLPIAWQGWVALGLFIALIAAASLLLAYSWLAYVSAFVTLTLLFVLVAARTTKGGWRWRWGDDD